MTKEKEKEEGEDMIKKKDDSRGSVTDFTLWQVQMLFSNQLCWKVFQALDRGVAASVCEWKHAGHANVHQMCQSPEKCTKPNQTLQKQYEQTGVQVQHYSLQLKNLHLHQLHVCFISPASY